MARELCVLADVTRLVPSYTTNVATDALLNTLITSESRAAHRQTGREFVTITGLTTRSFDIDERSARSRIVPIGDNNTITTVTVKDIQGTTLETVASSNYVKLPRIREEWEPVVELWFPKGAATPAGLASGYVLEVAGTWWFPSIPTDVVQAVAKLVLVRYLSDAAAAGTALADALNEQEFNAGVAFASAQDVLRGYLPATFA